MALEALAARREPRPPLQTIEISRNAKGDVQWTIQVAGEDAFRAEQDAREIHDRLTRTYPHSSLLDAEPSLKAALTASVAEQDAGKTAAKAAAIARSMAKGKP